MAEERRRGFEDRCFPEPLPDYPLPSVNGNGSDNGVHKDLTLLLREPSPSLFEKFLQVAIHLKDQVVQATWIDKKRHIVDTSMYTGVLGTAFLCFKAFEITGNTNDLDLCLDIVGKCARIAKSTRWNPTFIVGQPGIYALGAVAANQRGDKQLFDEYARMLNEDACKKALSEVENEMPYELLYGRAGFLWAVSFLNKKIGYEVVSEGLSAPILGSVLEAGRASSSHSSCPLMFQWHGKRYWGAAHGLAGIMHTLIQFKLEEADMESVKTTLKYMINNRFANSGNYRSSEENPRDILVHWCHGAPGIALTLCKAAEIYPNEEVFKQAAIEAGDVVWRRGLLRRVGLCHGVSGNAYVFLALSRLLGNELYSHRAKAFACFLLGQARTLISSGEMHGGDRPYSLFEGLAGTAWLFLDMTQPHNARFPCYEL